SHTILLIQTSQAPSSKTYIECASVATAMDELISMYEEILKSKYPHKERIEFDVNEVLEMVYNLPDCAALVFDPKSTSYVPHDKTWIQKQIVIRAKIALFACFVFLFIGMYGLRGTKPAEPPIVARSDPNLEKTTQDQRANLGGPLAPPSSSPAQGGQAEGASAFAAAGPGPDTDERSQVEKNRQLVREALDNLAKKHPDVMAYIKSQEKLAAAVAPFSGEGGAQGAEDRNSIHDELDAEDTEEIVIGGNGGEKVEDKVVEEEMKPMVEI
ncbi:hypothetical protein BGZ73_006951, partial [Actinomortierella ambigua]